MKFIPPDKKVVTNDPDGKIKWMVLLDRYGEYVDVVLAMKEAYGDGLPAFVDPDSIKPKRGHWVYLAFSKVINLEDEKTQYTILLTSDEQRTFLTLKLGGK